MSTERNRVYLQHPTKEGELLPAQLLKEDEGVLSVRLLDELMLTPNTETKQYFHDHNDLFYGFSCHILRMESGGPNPVVAVKQTGPKERHEKRETFRLPVYDDMVTAIVNGRHNAKVHDISFNGMAIVVDHESYGIDSWLDIELTFDCVTINGQMQVRNRVKTRDGRFRYGLQADPVNRDFRKELERITQALQNMKARRASRLGTNNKHGAKAAADAAIAELEKKAEAQKLAENESKMQDAESDDSRRDRRMHERKAWAGPAKVYILEDRQLRVLEVNTVDLSQGGICFFCRQYVYKDAEILFEKPSPGGLFRVVAKVCSVEMVGDGLHRVGIQFVGTPLKPGETHPTYYMV